MQLCKKCREWNIDGCHELCPKCQFIHDMVRNNAEVVIEALEQEGYKVIKA
jgi:hypothetical protein